MFEQEIQQFKDGEKCIESDIFGRMTLSKLNDYFVPHYPELSSNEKNKDKKVIYQIECLHPNGDILKFFFRDDDMNGLSSELLMPMLGRLMQMRQQESED